jgi:hypothetical protein
MDGLKAADFGFKITERTRVQGIKRAAHRRSAGENDESSFENIIGNSAIF